MIDWLAEARSAGDAAADRLLAESAPVIADDLANYVTARDAWADTFALWVFTRYPRALAETSDLITALCARYVGVARRNESRVVGRHFPFHDIPLPSATAHLTAAVAALGIGTDHLAEMIKFIIESRRDDGGWGDPEQPSDVLTTIASARALATLMPGFDPGSALPFIENAVAGPSGASILGPEAPWVEGEVAAFRALAIEPFQKRFAWPHVADWALDPHTGIPRFDAFLDLARLFEQVPSLAEAPVEVAFVDLANFGSWNTRFGQAAGDDHLRFVADQLRQIPDSRVIRDGGDEFLVVGAPERKGVARDLEALFATWDARWHARMSDLPSAAPRAVALQTTASRLRSARERLGVEIGGLKARVPSPDRGVVESF